FSIFSIDTLKSHEVWFFLFNGKGTPMESMSEIASKKVGIKKLKLSDIKLKENFSRASITARSVETLMKSIKYEGLINPLTVNLVNGDYNLVCGYRRQEALI